MNQTLLNDFTKTIQPLARRYDIHRLFDDLLTMVMCSYHQINIQSQLQQQDQANEALYLETIGRYEKDELSFFAQLAALIQSNVLSAPYSDLLGEYFMQEISRGHNGQYFTPTPICEMKAKMQIADTKATGLRVADPACGSGRMLLSAAKLQPANFFYGADVSQTCAKMAVLNFFFNGLRGEVSWMNSLSNEWFGGWQINMNGLGIVPLESKEQSEIVLRLPESKALQPSNSESNQQPPAQQLTLF
ncbi:MAG: N-6 DNA methylase [Bacteroidota bacterium]